jgi:hypothetical protein
LPDGTGASPAEDIGLSDFDGAQGPEDAAYDGGAAPESGSDSGSISTGGADASSDAGPTAFCLRPADCPNASPYCCATWSTGQGTFPSCPVDPSTFMAGCAAICTSSFPLTCNAKSTARLCTAKSDCTEAGYGECCDFGSNAGTSPFMCISGYAKPYAQTCK